MVYPFLGYFGFNYWVSSSGDILYYRSAAGKPKKGKKQAKKRKKFRKDWQAAHCVS
jgi:hypothetical protein